MCKATKKAFLEDRARELIKKVKGSPLLMSYSSDGAPLFSRSRTPLFSRRWVPLSKPRRSPRREGWPRRAQPLRQGRARLLGAYPNAPVPVRRRHVAKAVSLHYLIELFHDCPPRSMNASSRGPPVVLYTDGVANTSDEWLTPAGATDAQARELRAVAVPLTGCLEHRSFDVPREEIRTWLPANIISPSSSTTQSPWQSPLGARSWPSAIS